MRLDEKISRFQAAWLADSHKTHGLPWASIPRCFHGVIATDYKWPKKMGDWGCNSYKWSEKTWYNPTVVTRSCPPCDMVDSMVIRCDRKPLGWVPLIFVQL